MSNELKIKILKDSQGNRVSLDEIPIDAADALNVFINALTEFAKTYEDTSDVKLKLENGCIETTLVLPDNDEVITEEIDDIISNKSRNKERVKLFKTIQDKIQLNGLEYQVFLKKQNQPDREVTDVFKETKFTNRRNTYIRKYSIEFLEGVLYAAGGKGKVNVHIENQDLGKEFKVECTREQAKKLNERLYSKVYLSVIKEYIRGKGTEYNYIDSYLTDTYYNLYKSLHQTLISTDDIDKYDVLYNYIVNTLNDDNADNQELIKLIRLYNNKFSEKGIVRTILMSLKPIINTEIGIKPHYDELVKTFKSRSSTKKI